MTSRRILIVGGSTRAAADSVRRAGWDPVCADLFADLDLRMTAEVIPVRNYPHSLADDVANVRADGWFYCGALENHPGIVAKIESANASYGPLLGTSASALKFVRDPFWLAETLMAAGMNALRVASASSPPDCDGTWVQKPLASAGGRSIRVWDTEAAKHPFLEPHYFQHRVNGVSLSALFRVEGGEIEWLGASQEIVWNTISRPPTSFAYCGSKGPLDRISPSVGDDSRILGRVGLSTFVSRSDEESSIRGNVVYDRAIQRQLNGIAKTLVRCLSGRIPETNADSAESFLDLGRSFLHKNQGVDTPRSPKDAGTSVRKTSSGLRGIIGLDFRLDGRNVWVTEVNPRYTASVEVIEFATGRSLLNPDATAGDSTADPTPGNPSSEPRSPMGIGQPPNRPLRRTIVAKQILYASHTIKAANLSRFVATRDPWMIPQLSDIPVPGTVIEPGWPICTVMASGANFRDVDAALCRRLSEIRDLLN